MFRSVPEKNLSIGSVSQDPVECNPLGKPRWCAGGGGEIEPTPSPDDGGISTIVFEISKGGKNDLRPFAFSNFWLP